MRSAAEQQLVGWPLPASDVARIESIRSRVAMFFRAGISEARSMDMDVRKFYRQHRSQQREAVRGGVATMRRRARRPTGRQNARRVGAIVGAGRDDGGAAIVGILVQRREPAEHARRARS